MIKIYGVHGSPFVRKVYVALEHKQIEYEKVVQMPFSGDADYLSVNPAGKIPTLVHDDLTIGDSKVICRYIEKMYPHSPLYPSDPVDLARADWLEEICGGAVSDLVTRIFFERFMKPLAFKSPADEELISKLIESDIPPWLDYLEAQLNPNGFLFGDFQMVDLCIASPFINAQYAGYEVNPEKWPTLSTHIQRVKQQESVNLILVAEAKALGRNSL